MVDESKHIDGSQDYYRYLQAFQTLMAAKLSLFLLQMTYVLIVGENTAGNK